MNKLCLALLVALVVPSIATAGGGNTKKTGTLVFGNQNPQSVLYVIVASNDVLASTNQANFTKNGGKVVTGVGSATFSNLKAGVQTFATAFTASGAPAPGPGDFTPGAATVKSGETVTVNP